MICQKLYDEDNSFCQFKDDYQNTYCAHKCIVDDIKRDCNKAKTDLKLNKGMFEMILKNDPDAEDMVYGKTLGKFLNDQEENV